MFADDTKIFREIKTLGDASSLQKDLGKLATWSQSSGLLFNEAKCVRRSTEQGKQSRSYPLTNSTTAHLNYYSIAWNLSGFASRKLSRY